MRFGRDMTRQNTCCTPNVLRVAAKSRNDCFFSWHVSQFDAARLSQSRKMARKPAKWRRQAARCSGQATGEKCSSRGRYDFKQENNLCGYQGWFNCRSDGMELGWKRWAKNARETLGPGNVTVDLWPDVSELPEKVQYPSRISPC